jgi:hypothetical protein
VKRIYLRWYAKCQQLSGSSLLRARASLQNALIARPDSNVSTGTSTYRINCMCRTEIPVHVKDDRNEAGDRAASMTMDFPASPPQHQTFEKTDEAETTGTTNSSTSFGHRNRVLSFPSTYHDEAWHQPQCHLMLFQSRTAFYP